MPLQTINYAGIPIQKPDYSGLENFIPNMLSGYKAAKEPARMRAEQEKLENESQTAKLNRVLKERFGVPEAEAALENKTLANDAQRTKNQYLPSSEEQRIALQRAQAGYYDRMPQARPGEGDNSGGLVVNPETGTEGVKYGGGVNEKLLAAKESSADMKIANSMVEARKIIDKISDIVEDHPNLGGSLAYMLSNAGEKKGIFNYFKRMGLDKKDLAAVEKIDKLGSELVMRTGEQLGGKNFTDAKQKLIELTKPSPGNTDESNEFILNNLREFNSGGDLWAKDLRWGQKNRIKIISDPERYREIAKGAMQRANPNQAMQIQGQSPDSMRQQQAAPEGMIRATINGKSGFIPANQKQDFISRGGQINE